MQSKTLGFGVWISLLAGCASLDLPERGEVEDANGVGGSGGGGQQAASATSASSATSGVGGGGGGTSVSCDEVEGCADYTSGCSGCAVMDICSVEYETCNADESCSAYNVCVHSCGSKNFSCQQACADNNTTGEERYMKLLTCVVCTGCPTACADFMSICPK
jgi:hypothetical protein